MNAEFFGPDSLTSTDFRERAFPHFLIFRERNASRKMLYATCFSCKQSEHFFVCFSGAGKSFMSGKDANIMSLAFSSAHTVAIYSIKIIIRG